MPNDPTPWHARLPPGSTEGLTGAEAERRLAADGPNRLPQAPAPSLAALLLRE